MRRAALGPLLATFCTTTLVPAAEGTAGAQPADWAASDDSFQQEPRATHSFYYELLGATLYASLNYDHRVGRRASARLGLAVKPTCGVDTCGTALMVPMSIHGLTGDGNHHFEYGGGFTAASPNATTRGILTPQAGYRYQRPEGGFMFRATALTPVLLEDISQASPFVGVSFGFSR